MRRRVVRSVLGLVLVFAVVDGVIGQRGLLSNMSTRQSIAALRASNDTSARENDVYKEDIRLLREDPAAVEELARRQLGLIKDGELLIILRDMPGAGTMTTPQMTTPQKIRADASAR